MKKTKQSTDVLRKEDFKVKSRRADASTAVQGQFHLSLCPKVLAYQMIQINQIETGSQAARVPLSGPMHATEFVGYGTQTP